MHTITLQVKDSMYEHFLYLLKNLNPKEITVLDEKVSDTPNSFKEDISKLFQEANISAFQDIDDPVAWQREQRDEW